MPGGGGGAVAVVVVAPFESRISLHPEISPLLMQRLPIADYVALAIAVAPSYCSIRLFSPFHSLIYRCQ